MKDAANQPKPTLLQQMGGVSGLIYASLPSVVFVVADTVAGLNAAVALAVGAGIAGWLLLRKEPLQPAFSGLPQSGSLRMQTVAVDGGITIT